MKRFYLLSRKRARLLKVTSNVQPQYNVNNPLSITLSPTGGLAPYVLSLFSGTLPAGLSISGLTISGTPTQAGTTNLDLRILDKKGTFKPVYLGVKIV